MVCEGAAAPETFTLTGEPSKGEFEGTLPTGTSNDCYAVVNYFEKKVAVNGENLDLDIKQDKYAWANGIPKEGIPLVAKVENGGSQFKHIFGLLKVTLSATESFFLKRMTVHDLAGNMLWGTCSVPIKEDGSLDCDNITMTEGDNTITMTLNDPKEITSTPVAYYLPIPQGALADGFSIVLYEYDKTKTADNEVGRAYTFMQKITGTKAMPRAGILEVNAPVTAKPEAYEANGRGYYKSLFVNAGKGLDAFKPGDQEDGIPAIEYMGLGNDYEYINTSNTDTQTGIIIQNDDDANGVLLYPDGSPRFRLVFNRGGNSVSHGQSLGEDGRGRFKTFFDNGGSYSGVCAGAFLAAQDVSDADDKDKPFTYNLIPVTLTHTGLPHPMSGNPAIYTNMEILSGTNGKISGLNGDGKFNLLLGGTDPNIYTINSNVGIKDVRHHGGGYLPDDQSETDGVETLMKYWYSETYPGDETDFRYYREDNFYTDYPTNKNKNVIFWSNSQYGTDDIKLDGPGKYHYISAWAYKKPNGNTGRAVCTGSHPEVPGRDCDVQFTGFMFRYAMEGNGEAFVKSTDLTLGQTRYMNATPSSYDNPADNDAGIGDRQYHHFKFEVPAGGYDNFILKLDSKYDSNSGIDLYLGLRKGDKAWLSNADYTLCNKGGQKEIRIKHLPFGTWYVSVFCATKVTASQSANYCTYSGKTQVLNGVPYSIGIMTDGYVGDYTPKPFGGGDGDDFTDSMDD